MRAAEDSVMTRLRFDRPLDDAEKDLLNWLTMREVVNATGCSFQTAADVLDQLVEESGAFYRADHFDAYVEIAGRRLIHCERVWLAFHAHAADWLPDSPPRPGGRTDPRRQLAASPGVHPLSGGNEVS